MEKRTRKCIAALSLIGAATLAPAVVSVTEAQAGELGCLYNCPPSTGGGAFQKFDVAFVKITDAMFKVETVLEKLGSDAFFKVDLAFEKLLFKFGGDVQTG